MANLFVVMTILFLTTGVLIALSAINGFIVSKLWLWFIVPTFHLPDLSIVQAIGMCLVIAVILQSKNNEVPKRDKASFWPVFTGTILGQFMVLALGWVLKTWFM